MYRFSNNITKHMTYESANEWDEVIIRILSAPNSIHCSGGMTTSNRSTTLGSLSSVVVWGVMIIPALLQRAIGHSNIRYSSLIVMRLGSSILSTIIRWVPVCVPLVTVPHIVTHFTT